MRRRTGEQGPDVYILPVAEPSAGFLADFAPGTLAFGLNDRIRLMT